jgi:hypothetical protein
MRLATLLLPVVFAPSSVAAQLDFNRDVRPILSDACFACHGPDEAKAKAKLRLDTREHALKPAKSGAVAIVPGKPDESELVKRIFTSDVDDLMPPEKAHKVLTAAQKETLRRWIAEGAHYQGHWAFGAPTRPVVPTVPAELATWVRTPIDAFIAARLAEEKLAPRPEASRETLIRRATLDLTGLPPTTAEVDAFLADRSPDAYEKVLDRLFQSPRYGEHMAVRWLDAARYADSHGFQTDSSRTMWPWRDWVINAFNANQPFDRFTVEQLAGDLLPDATPQQVVASGFNRNHRINGEGGIIDEEWRIENVIDRVETTGQTWMALTLGCARCHDHKYDPISQKEFFQLFAYFNDVAERGTIQGASNRSGGNPDPIMRLLDDGQKKRQADLERSIAGAQQELAEVKKRMPELQRAWEAEFIPQLDRDVPAWTALMGEEAKSLGGAILMRQSDGTWLAGGTNPSVDTYEITAPIPAGQLTGVRLSVLPDASLPNASIGRAGNGNFVLSDIEAEIRAPSLPQPLHAAFTTAKASHEQKGWEIGLILLDPEQAKKKSKNQSGWAPEGNDLTKRSERRALFLCQPLEVPEGATITVRLLQRSKHPQHNIGRFALSISSLPPALLGFDGAKVPESLNQALHVEPAKRTDKQKEEVAKFFRENTDHPEKAAEAEVKRRQQALDDFLAKVPSVMVMRELEKPREARLLIRGEYDKPGEVVTRALPAFLPALPAGAPNNRLGLARWLVADNHPLTARVWINRTWEQFFGTGIVTSTENFGSQADWPTHPALLDWLAVEFMQPTVAPAVAGMPAQRWDMKAMQKLLLMSAAYRQDTRLGAALAERDPDNRLLARGPRFRLGAEMLRDQALAVSGLLVEKIGGPSVRPYMPANIWDEVSVYGDMRGYKADTGDGLWRRTLYTVWKRTAAPPSLLLFDSPNREICVVKRSRSNTPLQALALLNEVTYVEAARRLAERMLADGGATAADRIAWAFRRATARRPTADEMAVLNAGLERRLAAFHADPAKAKALIATGTSKPDAQLDPVELAAYTTTANVILNLDEVVTRE